VTEAEEILLAFVQWFNVDEEPTLPELENTQEFNEKARDLGELVSRAEKYFNLDEPKN